MKININSIPEEGLELRATKDRTWLPNLFGGTAGDEFTLEEVQVYCHVSRLSQTVFLDGRLETVIHMVCSRCLEEAELPVNVPFRYTLMPAVEDNREEVELTEEDLEYGVYDGETIDCDPLIYEQIVLQIPMKVLCRDDCRGLCPQCGANLNTGVCSCTEKAVDERLAVLKKFNSN
ncbi:MAG: DUF177 domain-containing protein [Syntrophobacterales bacterium]|nr:DUF177 domain-containing protein [Syntrophobacterales bacterium]